MDAIMGIAITCVFFIPALCLFFLGVSEYNKKVVVRSDSVFILSLGKTGPDFFKKKRSQYTE